MPQIDPSTNTHFLNKVETDELRLTGSTVEEIEEFLAKQTIGPDKLRCIETDEGVIAVEVTQTTNSDPWDKVKERLVYSISYLRERLFQISFELVRF